MIHTNKNEYEFDINTNTALWDILWDTKQKNHVCQNENKYQCDGNA